MTISPLALAAKKVIEAAWLHGPSYDLASQAAFALESAQLLQSPETAADTEQLRAKYTEAAATVAQLVLERGERMKVENALRDRVAELEQQLAAKDHPVDEDPIAYALTEKAADVTPRVRGLRELVAGQRAALEDPHDSPLHHGYRVGRDLPEVQR
ncbi:hypothetical protein SAMN04487981_101646 [Streptomyces sp. cf386]|uniref:hypothetical protein n=1 Tax=Streptomyces sp. cf386 TaxID=1761904 RepID=UPI00088901C0|nr:hypothetical protein [Streptomyces sp. cf386]SDM47606.1 hypothetical protein SAMN04487981_101646 [Streptomyces sp. cf386]